MIWRRDFSITILFLLNRVKMYYYVFFDVVIVGLIASTYAIIIYTIQRRNQHLSIAGGRKEKLRMQMVALSLILSFVLCNCVPDMWYTFFFVDHTKFDVIPILWSLGYLLDPIIYIFTTQEMRRIAAMGLINLICCRTSSYFASTTTTITAFVGEVRYFDYTYLRGIFVRLKNSFYSPYIRSTSGEDFVDKNRASKLLSASHKCQPSPRFLTVSMHSEKYHSEILIAYHESPCKTLDKTLEKLLIDTKRCRSASYMALLKAGIGRSRSLPCIWS